MSSQLYGQPGPSHRISHPERTGCGGLSSSLQLKIPTSIRQSITIQRIFFIFSSIWVGVKGYSLKTGIWHGFKISKYHIQIKVLLGGTHQWCQLIDLILGHQWTLPRNKTDPVLTRQCFDSNNFLDVMADPPAVKWGSGLEVNGLVLFWVMVSHLA